MVTGKMPSKRIPPAVGKSERRGVVDLIAIRKNGRQPSGDILNGGEQAIAADFGL
jgi:hypothetical protein